MAKITEEASATVSMNMEPARKSFEEWTEAIDKGKKKLEELLAVPEHKRDNKAIREIEEGIAKATKEADKAEKKLKTFRDTLKNLNSASMNDLYKASKELEAQIKRLTPGTKEFIAATHDLKMVKTRLNDLRDGFKAVTAETTKSRKTFKDWIGIYNHYWGAITMTAKALTSVSTSFRQCAEDAAKLDDVYADVMKTTGLLHDQVEALDKELMKIDTRTSREQLLLLARDAGKLGISGQEDILGFVRAADQIQVALGEDLGDGAIRNLGKIADVLGYTASMGIEKSLLSIASAVNAVGQASTASEPYIVDFTQRLAGVAAQTGISAANIIGFASGLDQSAMKVEMASTAFQKFIMKLYEDPAKFAEYANMQVKDFTELLANDANQAIITVLKSLKDKDGFASLVPIFKDLGLDGARAVSVLAAMATNIDAVTEAQALANMEFSKATSVSEEYATKNNNLQAQLEKARKEFKNASIALGQSLNPVMLKSTKAVTYLVKALASYGKEIKAVLITVAALTVAFKLQVIWQKVVVAWNATLKAGKLALSAATALLTGNIQAATAAWAAMSAVMKTTIFGLVAAAISGLVIAIMHLNKETKELTRIQKYEKDLQKEISEVTSEEAARVQALRRIIEDVTTSYDNRKAAIEELREIVPDYHADLTEEGMLINNNVDALDNYVNAMMRMAKAQALQNKLAENASKQYEVKKWMEENVPQTFKDLTGEWHEIMITYDENNRPIRNVFKDDENHFQQLRELKEEEQVIVNMINEAGQDLQIISNKVKGNEPTIPEGKPKENNAAFTQALKDLEKQQRAEENVIKQSYVNREITAEEYEEQMRDIKYKFLEERLNLAKEYGQDETGYLSSMLDMEIEAQKLAQKEMERLAKEDENRRKEEQAKFEEEQKKLEKLMAEGEKVKTSLLTPSEARQNELAAELARLDELHQAKILSEQEYEEAVKRLREKYADEDLKEKLDGVAAYLQMVNTVMSEAANFVSSLQDAELAHAEANYQAQLTAAGNNAEQREAIETAYEKRKLEIQKKYADAEMAINIAKTVADGALAIARAFADMPYPAALVVSALIAGTTAAQVATIIAQRNAIKSSSVNASSSKYNSDTAATNNGKIGSRVITGYAKGGYTQGHTTLTTVGEEGVEYVIPHWMVRKNPVMVANLERYRKAGSHGRSGSMQRGFAAGGYTTPPQNAGDYMNNELIALLKEVSQTNKQLQQELSHGIYASVALSELDRKQKMLNKFKQKTSAL
jgi:TP901 family phage tail tape measure protein